jgi:hypothetical protein
MSRPKGKRMSLARVSSLTAWGAAVVTWFTVGVAVAETGTPLATSVPAPPAPAPVIQPVPASVVVEAPPSAPESGLFVLTYTPVEPPAPEVIIRTVVRQQASPRPTPAVASSGS